MSALDEALIATYRLYLEAHIAHWNVTGATFPQLHAFFGDIYEDAHGAVDGLAEHIRAEHEMVEVAFPEMSASGGTAAQLVKRVAAVNIAAGAAVLAASKEAESNPGLQNYLQERFDRHSKWNWMLRAMSE